jgi:hypothetical protein
MWDNRQNDNCESLEVLQCLATSLLWTIDAFYSICEVFEEVIIPSINAGVTVVAVPPISVELCRSSIPLFEVVFNEGVQRPASRLNSV